MSPAINIIRRLILIVYYFKGIILREKYYSLVVRGKTYK